jgi:hypothetical protein
MLKLTVSRPLTPTLSPLGRGSAADRSLIVSQKGSSDSVPSPRRGEGQGEGTAKDA